MRLPRKKGNHSIFSQGNGHVPPTVNKYTAPLPVHNNFFPPGVVSINEIVLQFIGRKMAAVDFGSTMAVLSSETTET